MKAENPERLGFHPQYKLLEEHPYHGKVLDQEPVNGYYFMADADTGQVFAISQSLPPGTQVHYLPTWEPAPQTGCNKAYITKLGWG